MRLGCGGAKKTQPAVMCRSDRKKVTGRQHPCAACSLRLNQRVSGWEANRVGEGAMHREREKQQQQQAQGLVVRAAAEGTPGWRGRREAGPRP